MKNVISLMVVLTSVCIGIPSQGQNKIQVVTTTQELAWAAREIGGAQVEARSILKGHEDPHFVDARPDFILMVSSADILCAVGMELEVGWLPKVLERAGNARVQPGAPGYCEGGSGVEALEKSSGPVDRSMGDVHAGGNPHYWLSPLDLAAAGVPIRDALIRVRPAQAEFFRSNWVRWKAELTELHRQINQRLAPARKAGPLIEYHRELSYFFKAYGLTSVGTIEEKPGVSPSGARVARVALDAKSSGVRLVIAGDHTPRGVLERFQEISGVPYTTVAFGIQSKGQPSTYVGLQNVLAAAVLKGLEEGK